MDGNRQTDRQTDREKIWTSVQADKQAGRQRDSQTRQFEEGLHLIGLLGSAGGLQGADEALRHQQQEARHAVQLVAVDLRLGDDWLRLGPTDDVNGSKHRTPKKCMG